MLRQLHGLNDLQEQQEQQTRRGGGNGDADGELSGGACTHSSIVGALQHT